MQFSVLERYFLFNLLATEEDDIATLRTVRKLRRALAFSEAEAKEINWRDDPDVSGRVRWDCEIVNPPEIEVTEMGRKIIAARFKAMEESGASLQASLLDLVDKFLEE